jgi:GTP cyclohydrolase I
MNARLPDVALNALTEPQAALDGVGMQDVALRLRLAEPGAEQWVNARASVQVDLPDPQRKGIHMSRLYLLLDGFAEQQVLSPPALARLMAALVESHADCGSRHAMLTLDFDLMLRRPALVTPGLAGWKAYPVRLQAHWAGGELRLDLRLTLAYSSTCPCSAALARQLLEQAFMADFASQPSLTPATVTAWIRQHASLATPHSQRSLAESTVRIAADAPALGLLALIDRAEAALGTPVQTAVKRADEQAFAQLNGGNLMYVEDAARRLHAALSPKFALQGIQVRHLESLHAHDAVARIGKG